VTETLDHPGLARRRLLMLAPLVGATAIGGAFMVMLNRMKTGAFDPHAIGDPLLGKPVPAFDLPGIGTNTGFSAADVRKAAATGPLLVNFSASWCISCVQEADLLGVLAQQGLTVWGITYKDTADKMAGFLRQYGNPYTRLADDASGRVGIDWGVSAVPESFLIDRTGRIFWHLAGPFSDENIRSQLEPALKAMT
jgi:cytochrome c biogenesis protein CcmG/thiol:disulfide interchange protein DsbE